MSAPTMPARLPAIALIAALACAPGCGENETSSPTARPSTTKVDDMTTLTLPAFTDVTAASGIDMVIASGASPSTQILEVNGSGLGLIDYDRDGDLDLFVVNGATMDNPEHGPGCRLYENLGNLEFRDVTAAAQLDVTRWAMGIAVGDYDADGFQDIYLTCYGPNVLLRNTGDGRFVDVTEAAGVGDRRWGTSCAFGDLDDDGDLDLYVVNYIDFDIDHPPPPSTYKQVEVLAGPHGLPAQHDVLYENLGDGTFRDATETSGCGAVDPSYGLGVLILDLTDDGRPDILVGNDSRSNFLFVNRGDLKFRDEGVLSGLASNMDGSEQATMGIGVADVNGNGLPDIFTSNFSSDTNTLHLNLDGTFFDDRTMQFGLGMISRPYLGWACGFHDFDHDGDEDLFIVNGHVYPNATRQTMDSGYAQQPLLFLREAGRFERVMAAEGVALAPAHRGRSAVFADLDHDGDIDIVTGELNGPVRVLRNDAEASPTRGDWLVVELVDDRPGVGNRHAVGARIELIDGGPGQVRWIYGGGGFQTAPARMAHFAMPRSPDGTARRVSLRITWPDATVQTVTDLAVNQRHVIKRLARRQR